MLPPSTHVLVIIIGMLGAMFLVHLQHRFDIGKGGVEYALTQLLVALGLLISGAGKCSCRGHCQHRCGRCRAARKFHGKKQRWVACPSR